jgi:hypothetical protein
LFLPFQVPSPSNTLSPIESHAHSPTMFSPSSGADSNSKGSPYSPAPDSSSRRLSTSTDSSLAIPTSSSGFSLLESLAEFSELQNRIKQEKDSMMASMTASSSPPPYPAVKIEPGMHQFPLHAPPPYSYSGGCVIKTEAEDVEDAAAATKEAALRVKMETVRSLAMQQVRGDIASTCEALDISSGK